MRKGTTMKSITRRLLVVTFSLILSFLLFTSVAEQARNQSSLQTNKAELLTTNRLGGNADSSQMVTVDGVTMRVTGPLLPDFGIFTSSAPGDAIQAATAFARRPFREVTIIAVPFGTKTAAEDLPVATTGGVAAFKSALLHHRSSQGKILGQEPVAIIFGQRVIGVASLLDLPVEGSIPTAVVIHEWVVEAGERLWIVRVSYQQSSGKGSETFFTPSDRTTTLTIESDSVYQPSTLSKSSSLPGDSPSSLIHQPWAPLAAGDLPAPSW